ncbi:hypothetical protein GCM10010987_73750 [Bradyrhizobium guangdongense]|uniref:Uncharacterized protein n=1 Tax=Bradyrhizobium guangdongense TaxID=1325090 RepID=A0AA87WFB6_9BRAD|nr:hypothetical protein GCM10010987_73750 [Bradyrhizobium guangdongense]
MLMTKERRSVIRTLRGWAVAVLQEAGAIQECEEHGWAKDRADPHARDRAIALAHRQPLSGPLPLKPSRRSATSWIRSATRARSVRTEVAEAAGNRDIGFGWIQR